MKALVKGNNEFAFDLYNQVRGLKGENVIFSPFSISIAIAMVYAGTLEKTEEEIAQVLHFTLGKEKVHEYFKMLKNYLVDGAARRGYTLNIANALWVKPGYPLLEDFMAVIAASYGGALFETDFSKPGVAAGQINGWISQQTNFMIKDLIDPTSLSAATSLIVTNAIYFLGKWLDEFDKRYTRPMPFWTTRSHSLTVNMMFQTKTFEYASGSGLQMLEMPYKSGVSSWNKDYDMSMVFLLPDDIEGLPSLEQSLSAGMLDQWIEQLRPNLADVYIPRFTMTLGFSLGRMLSNMGMNLALSFKDANFLGMTTKPGYYIQDVVHKAYVRVDEEGTEAAAATAITMAPTGPPPKKIVFKADHPFLFLIRDIKTGTILFLGRVVEPSE